MNKLIIGGHFGGTNNVLLMLAGRDKIIYIIGLFILPTIVTKKMKKTVFIELLVKPVSLYNVFSRAVKLLVPELRRLWLF